MGTIGGRLLKKLDAQAGEEVLWSKAANRTQGTNRAVGGKLFVTNQRVIFLPHLFDSALKGEPFAVPHQQIAAVGARDAGGDTFGGGLRKRLQIDLADGSSELFVVNKLDEIVAKLQQALKLN